MKNILLAFVGGVILTVIIILLVGVMINRNQNKDYQKSGKIILVSDDIRNGYFISLQEFRSDNEGSDSSRLIFINYKDKKVISWNVPFNETTSLSVVCDKNDRFYVSVFDRNYLLEDNGNVTFVEIQNIDIKESAEFTSMPIITKIN